MPAAGLIRQQKAEGLAGQHVAVDAGDLVGQRFDQRGMDRQDRVEQVGQVDAVGLGRQPEQLPIGTEAPGLPDLDRFQVGFIGAEQQLRARLAIAALVEQLHRGRAVPLHIDDGYRLAGNNPLDLEAGFQVFQFGHGNIALCTFVYRYPPVIKEKSASPLDPAALPVLRWRTFNNKRGPV